MINTNLRDVERIDARIANALQYLASKQTAIAELEARARASAKAKAGVGSPKSALLL